MLSTIRCRRYARVYFILHLLLPLLFQQYFCSAFFGAVDISFGDVRHVDRPMATSRTYVIPSALVNPLIAGRTISNAPEFSLAFPFHFNCISASCSDSC